MGKLVVTEFVRSRRRDGGSGGAEGYEHGGWTFKFDRGADGDKFKLDELVAADAQLLGRRTYEGFAKAWPSIEDEAGFADKMNSMPKFVVSRTLRTAEWTNTTMVDGDLVSEVGGLKERFAGNILVAGSRRSSAACSSTTSSTSFASSSYPDARKRNAPLRRGIRPAEVQARRNGTAGRGRRAPAAGEASPSRSRRFSRPAERGRSRTRR